MNKRELLQSIADSDLRTTAARFLDKVEQSGKYHEAVFTAFLSPVELQVCEKLLIQSHADVNHMCFGGHEDAEYKMIGLVPSYLTIETSDFPIQLIKARVTAKEHDLSHRDVLGSLMALGFSRNRIGDLWVSPDALQILCDQDMASYISAQLERIGRFKVDCSYCQLSDLEIPEAETETCFKTVSGLRLDAVLSAGFNLSRGSALDLIEGEKVKVNHLPVTKGSHILKEGDLIACRGKGRMILSQVDGLTKKDRIKIMLTKMC